MAGFGVTLDSNLGKLADRLEKNFGPVVGQALMRAAEMVAGEVRREISAWTSKTEARKTGALADSFRPTMLKNDAGEIVVGVFSKLPYARIHEFGGVITPKSRSALAVPLTNAARRLSPRAFPGLHLQKGPRAAVLADSSGAAQYALLQSVTIVAKHYLSKARAKVLPIVEPRIAQAIKDAITRTSG